MYIYIYIVYSYKSSDAFIKEPRSVPFRNAGSTRCEAFGTSHDRSGSRQPVGRAWTMELEGAFSPGPWTLSTPLVGRGNPSSGPDSQGPCEFWGV